MSMAIPMVLSMLINSLYNIVDSFFIAKISEDAMTAISLVFPLQNFAAAVSIGFGVGANALTAFFLGEGDQKRADGAASLSILLSLVHSAILTGVLCSVTAPFLQGFSGEQKVLDYGLRYGRIVFGFLFISQISLVYEKLFQAVGRVRITMISMIAGWVYRSYSISSPGGRGFCNCTSLCRRDGVSADWQDGSTASGFRRS